MIRVFVCLLFSLSLSATVLAATDEFNVSLFINGDVTPPTTPGLLSAVVVSTDQIDISWGASTDDYLMGGYQVYRDAVQIATTTLTTYSDTSLSASTSYSYNVIAFDSFFNISTSSNSVTTSTQSAIVVQTSGGSGTSKVELIDLLVVPDINSVLITWETNRYSRYQIRWGETEAYEIGFVASDVFKNKHQTVINELEPNTTYYYRLVAFDRGGNKTTLSEDEFKTLPGTDTTPPPNISKFRGIANGDDVVLFWDNPKEDFDYVRIVRNPSFYPTDPNNGYIVYQGADGRLNDNSALREQNIQYYTAFSYDDAGNRSSGATVAIRRRNILKDEGQQATEPGGTSEISLDNNATSTESEPLELSLDDIVIIQSGEVIRPVSGTYLVDTTKSFTISAPYELFPEHLKAIQITLFHPFDESLSHSFLLRINNDKTAYEATIENLGFSGTIPLRLVAYDFQTEETVAARGSIITKNLEPALEFIKSITPWYLDFVWFLVLLLIIVGWWLFGYKRRNDDEDNPPVRFA